MIAKCGEPLQRGFPVLVFVGVDLAVLELRALLCPQLDRHRGFGRVRRLGVQGEARSVGCGHDAEGVLEPDEQRHEVARVLDAVILEGVDGHAEHRGDGLEQLGLDGADAALVVAHGPPLGQADGLGVLPAGPQRAGPRAGRLSRPSCRHLPARSSPLPADAHEEFLEVLPGSKRILVGEAPPVDDADGVRHLLHLGEDVARDDHRRARRREAADLVAQLLDADGVETVGGLVEYEQAWPDDQRQREPQALPHAHREAPGALLPGVREVHGGEHLIYAALGKA